MKINGNLIVTKENQKTFKELTEVSGSVDVQEGATFTAPALVKVSGSVYVQEGATFTATALAESGSVYVQEGATFTAPALAGKNNTAFFDKKEHKVINNDGLCFYVTNERTSKGIKIYSGYHNVTIFDSLVQTDSSFVVEKDGFSAHGENLKKAISDLQFKVVSEKLKKEPINAETIITDQYYRIVTGACEFGVKQWRQQNGITQEKITAKELLPILERTNAYGFTQFKKLINF